MEQTLVLLCVFGLPALAMLAPLQFRNLRSQADASSTSISLFPMCWISLTSVIASLLIGALVGCIILVGPSLATGIGLDLMWLTMLPALIGFWWVVSRASAYIGRAMIRRHLRSRKVGFQ